MRTLTIAACCLLTLAAGCKKPNKVVSVDEPETIELPSEQTAATDTEPVMIDIYEPPAYEDVPPTSISEPIPTYQETTSFSSPEPAPEPERIPPPPTKTVHVVRKGDTLWSLAVKYLGSGRRWKDIRDANPGIDPKKLLVGQKLVIPQP